MVLSLAVTKKKFLKRHQKIFFSLAAVSGALFGARTAGIGTYLHLVVTTSQCCTAFGASSTCLRAKCAHFCASRRSSRGEVCTTLADGNTVEKELNVFTFGVVASFFQAVRESLQAHDMARGAAVRAVSSASAARLRHFLSLCF